MRAIGWGHPIYTLRATIWDKWDTIPAIGWGQPIYTLCPPLSALRSPLFAPEGPPPHSPTRKRGDLRFLKNPSPRRGRPPTRGRKPSKSTRPIPANQPNNAKTVLIRARPSATNGIPFRQSVGDNRSTLFALRSLLSAPHSSPRRGRLHIALRGSVGIYVF